MRHKKRKTLVALKRCMLISATFILMVFIFTVFEDKIALSAVKFTFYSTENENVTTDIMSQSYEEDFLTFLPKKTQHQSTVTLSSKDSIAVNLSALSGKYKNYNGTSIINNTDYNTDDLLYADYKKPELNKEQPYILLYHTHTSESYNGGGSVVDVGKAMAEEFEKLGYKTIHLTDPFDDKQFSGAYSRSIKGVEAILEKYPSITLAFDIHRDAITAANGDLYCPLTTIDGKNCAQVMFVCGTDAKGLSHPNWRENFKFALDVSRTMGENYGALSRPVNLRGDRFNTHVTNYSFLMEVGSNANTLDEAKLAAIHTARAVITTIEQ